MIHPQTRVSQELFSASEAAKKSYFDRGFVLKHLSLAKVFEDIKQSLREHTGKHIVIVAGPTGVGKTTLASRIVDYVYQDLVPGWSSTPHCIPAICVELNMEAGVKFDWKELYRQILDALDEPLLSRKSHIEKSGDRLGGRVLSGRAANPSDLRNQMKVALKDRSTRIIVVDELQHLFKHGGKTEQHYEVLKSLSSITECTVIGLGTYEVSGIIHWSAQVNRVASYLQFPQYKLASGADQQAFFGAYSGLLAHVPMDLDMRLLRPDLEFFYVGSCGCLGILKDWVYRALSRALATHSPTLHLEHFQSSMLSNKAIMRIIEAIREGEDSFAQPSFEETKHAVLGQASSAPPIVSGVEEVATGKKKRGRKPGQRNPVRDPAHVS